MNTVPGYPKEFLKSGPCIAGKYRHTYGKEIQVGDGSFHREYHEPCIKCGHIRVRIYGRRGNHIRGYIYAVKPPSSSPS